MNKIRGCFCHYFADLFKEYELYFSKPDNIFDYDVKDVFDNKAFLEKDNTGTDFYKEFFLTRTWLIFLEEKIAPQNVMQLQIHKQFSE